MLIYGHGCYVQVSLFSTHLKISPKRRREFFTDSTFPVHDTSIGVPLLPGEPGEFQ